MVKAYLYTTITSAMIINVVTIPSAFLLSLLFLKVRYLWNHYIAIAICIAGISFPVINDVLINPRNTDDQESRSALKGDLMALAGAFLFAL